MSKDTYYFRHDCNARQDENILALRMRHDWKGYGLYRALIERLRESSDYTCVKDYNVVAFDLRSDAATIKSVVEDFGLFTFTEDGKRFYSKRLTADMQAAQNLSESRKEAGRKAIQKRWGNQEKASQSQECNTPTTSQNDSKAIADLQPTYSSPMADLQPTYSSPIAIKEDKIKEEKKNKGVCSSARVRESESQALPQKGEKAAPKPQDDSAASAGALSTQSPAGAAPTQGGAQSGANGASREASYEASRVAAQDGAYISQIGRPQVGIGFIPQLWRECCPSLPEVSQLSPNRCTYLLDRIRREGITTATAAQALFRATFERVERSDFLTARTGGKGWKATLDWVLNPDNWAKITEGNYDNAPQSEGASARPQGTRPHIQRSPTALDSSKMNYSEQL